MRHFIKKILIYSGVFLGGVAIFLLSMQINGFLSKPHDLTNDFNQLQIISDKKAKFDANQDMIIYFGFTNCADVCPIALAKLTEIFKSNPEIAQNLPAYFITLDPNRDTPAVMSEYLKNYDPNIMAVFGSESQIAAITEKLSIHHSHTKDKLNINHESFFVMLNLSQNRYRLIADSLEAAKIADFIREFHEAKK